MSQQQSEPLAQFYTDFHAYRWPEGVELHVERFVDKGDTFAALLTFVLDDGQNDPVLVSAPRRLNFHAERSVGSHARHIASRLGRLGIDQPPSLWEERLEYVAYHTWRQYQEGTNRLMTVEEIDMSEDRQEILPPIVARNGVTVLYGDASAGKSMFAAALATSIAAGAGILGVTPVFSGPVIYYDWEDSAVVFRERVEAICRGAGIPVPEALLYRPMERTVVAGEERIRREVEETGAVFTVFDSMGEMLGGDPSDPTLVIPAVGVMKRVGVPALGLHHLSAEQAASTDVKKKMKPYGSVYARSGARKLWLIDRFQEEEADEGTIYLINTKVNRGKLSRRLSWLIQYGNERTDIGEGHGEVTTLREVGYSSRSAADYFDRLRADMPAEKLTITETLRRIFDSSMGSAAYPLDTLVNRVSKLRGSTTTEQTVRNKLRDLVAEGFIVTFRKPGEETMWALASRYRTTDQF